MGDRASSRTAGSASILGPMRQQKKSKFAMKIRKALLRSKNAILREFSQDDKSELLKPMIHKESGDGVDVHDRHYNTSESFSLKFQTLKVKLKNQFETRKKQMQEYLESTRCKDSFDRIFGSPEYHAQNKHAPDLRQETPPPEFAVIDEIDNLTYEELYKTPAPTQECVMFDLRAEIEEFMNDYSFVLGDGALVNEGEPPENALWSD